MRICKLARHIGASMHSLRRLPHAVADVLLLALLTARMACGLHAPPSNSGRLHARMDITGENACF